MLDFNDMSIFYHVAQQKSVAKASEILGIPRSTISRKLVQLEERLGVRLVQRTTRTLQLTDIGQTCFQYCSEMMGTLDDIEAAISLSQSEPAGRLRLTAPNAFGEGVVGDLISDFAKAYPNIELDFHFTNERVDLVNELYDAAFRLGPLADSSYTARVMADGSLVLVASPKIFAKKRNANVTGRVKIS